jgi:hypothetical protein|tara:strand:+ start:754 stop:942 length:189 start_codon:yes stop_codon:yes gene_type:complete
MTNPNEYRLEIEEAEAAYRLERDSEDPSAWYKKYREECINGWNWDTELHDDVTTSNTDDIPW